jgi:hypothetical protein
LLARTVTKNFNLFSIEGTIVDFVVKFSAKTVVRKLSLESTTKTGKKFGFAMTAIKSMSHSRSKWK